jgi:hypothetical protein
MAYITKIAAKSLTECLVQTLARIRVYRNDNHDGVKVGKL